MPDSEAKTMGADPKFEWKVARTQAHLHMDGRFTGISLPIGDRHPELSEWRTQVLDALTLPPIPGVRR